MYVNASLICHDDFRQGGKGGVREGSFEAGAYIKHLGLVHLPIPLPRCPDPTPPPASLPSYRHPPPPHPTPQALRFGRGNKSIVGMVSSEKESFPFQSNVAIEGPVEVWMKNVEEEMCNTLYQITKEGVFYYAKSARWGGVGWGARGGASHGRAAAGHNSSHTHT